MEDQIDTSSLEMYKNVSIATSVWEMLLKKGGMLMRAWTSVNEHSLGEMIKTSSLRAIRDYIFSVLKGILNDLFPVRPSSAYARSREGRVQRIQKNYSARTSVRAHLQGKPNQLHVQQFHVIN